MFPREIHEWPPSAEGLSIRAAREVPRADGAVSQTRSEGTKIFKRAIRRRKYNASVATDVLPLPTRTVAGHLYLREHQFPRFMTAGVNKI